MSSATASAAASSTAITLKTVFNGDSRRFVLNKPSFSDLIHQLSVYYPQLSGADVALKYEDDENEWITITTDNELLEAFHVANKAGNKPLRLTVSSNAAPSGPAPAAAAASGASSGASSASTDPSAATIKAVVSDSTLPHSPAVHTTTPRESPVQVESKVTDPPVSAPPSSINPDITSTTPAPSSAPSSSASTVKVTDVNEKDEGEQEDDESSDDEEENNNNNDDDKDVSDVLGALLGLGTELSGLLSSNQSPESASSCASSLCGNRSSACSRAAASETKSDEYVWGNIECDGCGVFPLRGVRFTCTVCKDFDLCASCEAQGVHPRHHPLIKAQLPLSAAKDEKAIHTHITCDGCGAKPIQGLRFKCTVCPDFDLCERCEARRLHPADHPLLKLRMERRLPAVLPAFLRGSALNEQPEQPHAHAQPQRPPHHPFHPFHRFNPFRFFSRPQPRPHFQPPCHVRFQQPQHGPQHPFLRSGGCGGRVPGRCALFVARPVFPESAASNAASSASTSPNQSKPAEEKADSKPVDKAVVPAIAVKFVRDVNLTDGSAVVGGSSVVKTWQLQNVGSASWPVGTKLIFVRGDRELIGEVEEFPVESVVLPGSVVDVSVPLAVPLLSSSSSSLQPEPRRHVAYFQLADADRRVFGPRVWVDLKVVAHEEEKETESSVPATPTPAPAPAAATATATASSAVPASDDSSLIATVATAPAAAPVAPLSAPDLNVVRPPSPHDWVDLKAESAAPAPAPAPVSASAPSSSAPAPNTSTNNAESGSGGKYAKQLSALQQMGFDNVSVNTYLLDKNHGDLMATANWLIEHTK